MKHLRKVALMMLATFMLFTLVACGSTWVDLNLGIISTKCTPEEAKELKEEDDPMTTTLLSTACIAINKQFARDVRCKDGRLQVKCK